MNQPDEIIYVDEAGNRVNPPNSLAPQMSNFAPVAPQNKGDKADLLDKIKPDLIVETIRHKLMGEEFINGKWVAIPVLKEKGLTTLGAWEISNLMLGVSSQNVSLSKLNDKEIRARTLEIVKTAQYMMVKNWDAYGIKGKDQLYFVHQIIMSNTFITLKQPEGEGIRKLLSGTISEVRQYSNMEQQRRGLFGGLFRK